MATETVRATVAQTALRAGALRLPSIFMQSLTMVASDSIVDGCRYPPFRFDEVRGIFATTDPIPVLKLKEWRC